MSISVSPYNPTQQSGVRAKSPPDLVVSVSRAPGTSDFGYIPGTFWLWVGDSMYVLLSTAISPTSKTANWAQVTNGGSGGLSSLTGDTGTANPVAGAIKISGGTTGLTTSASGSTVTVGGTLGVANGGTGVATLTAHGVLVGEGTSAVTAIAPSATAGVPLISAGAAADPIYGTAVVAGGGTGATSFATFAPVCSGATGTTALQAISSGSTNSVLQGAGSAYPFFSDTPTIVKLNLVAGSNQAVNSTAAMTAGTITVNNTMVTSSSFIICYPAVLGTVTVPQPYYISAIVNGTSFTITSGDPTDTSTWHYMIVN